MWRSYWSGITKLGEEKERGVTKGIWEGTTNTKGHLWEMKKCYNRVFPKYLHIWKKSALSHQRTERQCPNRTFQNNKWEGARKRLHLLFLAKEHHGNCQISLTARCITHLCTMILSLQTVVIYLIVEKKVKPMPKLKLYPYWRVFTLPCTLPSKIKNRQTNKQTSAQLHTVLSKVFIWL